MLEILSWIKDIFEILYNRFYGSDPDIYVTGTIHPRHSYGNGFYCFAVTIIVQNLNENDARLIHLDNLEFSDARVLEIEIDGKTIDFLDKNKTEEFYNEVKFETSFNETYASDIIQKINKNVDVKLSYRNNHNKIIRINKSIILTEGINLEFVVS